MLVSEELTDYGRTVYSVMDRLGAAEAIAGRDLIAIKPNLVKPSPPPVTTDVRFVEALAGYCLDHSRAAKVVVIEGSGECETGICFEELGYVGMTERLGVELVDADTAETVVLADPEASVFRQITVPKIALDSYLISAPVLKDHTMTDVTLGIKNLIGLLPASEYGGYWSYRKSQVHKVDVDKVIVDIAGYCPIDLSIIDGALGMSGGHLNGTVCDPPIGLVIGSDDPLEADVAGSKALGHDWTDIDHLRLYSERFSGFTGG